MADQIFWADTSTIFWADGTDIQWAYTSPGPTNDGIPPMSKQRAQSSTTYPMNFLMVLTSDHITGATGLTVTVTLSKNGAAFGAAAGAVTEIGNGWYSLAGNATDRATLGELLIHATSATADPTDEKYEIITVDAFAAQFAANVTQWNGTNVASPATAGVPEVNVKNINNQTATAAAGVTFPASIASPTNITAGTITTATNLTTNNDKTGYTLTSAGANAAADALLDRSDAIETGLTPRQALRLTAAGDGGLVSGAGTTTVTIKGAGVSTTRVTGTVDTNGNRTGVTLNL